MGVLPFFIKVEGPCQCRQGEQVGLRVVVFNYQPQDIEAVVVLAASPDYKFVHVEENGIVSIFFLFSYVLGFIHYVLSLYYDSTYVMLFAS